MANLTLTMFFWAEELLTINMVIDHNIKIFDIEENGAAIAAPV